MPITISSFGNTSSVIARKKIIIIVMVIKIKMIDNDDADNR